MRRTSKRISAVAIGTAAAVLIAELALSSTSFPSESVAIIPDPYLHHVHLKNRTFVAHHPSGEFVFMAVPSSYKLHGGDVIGKADFHARVKAFAGANGLRFLDLYSPFEKATAAGTPLFFKHDVHFTAEGHAVAAEVAAALFPGT